MPFSYNPSKFLAFRDMAACEKVRSIKKEDITKHANPDFKIKVIEDLGEFYASFAIDIVSRIVKAKEEGRKVVMILPVGPVPQYTIAAEMINRLGIDCKHLWTFNMDEYADDEGRTAPPEWAGSFRTSMMESFFLKLDPALRVPEKQIHFPSSANINDYGKMIEDAGNADVCYGGIGWSGHIAFWEPHLAADFGGNLEAWKKAGPRIVELHPITIMQNALHSFNADWSWVPPKAASIGPAQILGARDRSFWLDGMCGPAGSMSWQRFIARLVAHGPVTPWVPGSILQTVPSTYTILGGVAENVEINMR
ncbi:MAG: sugar phosphate isomerase family [Anaerolineae bacterium]